MSTHGCFSPSFPPFPSTWLSQPDAGGLEPDATVDDVYYPGGAYYYVQAADDDQEELGGSQAGGLRLFRSVSQFVLAFYGNLFNLCLYSDIVASADSSMIELLYSSLRGPWLVI